MLSDIGEVTEVESTPGNPPRRTSLRHISDRGRGDSDGEMDVPSRASTGRRHDELLRRSRAQRYRSNSVGSNSTVTTTQDHTDHFADFDDAISVDDSNFQGDDEESIAESTAEDMTVRQAKFLPQPHGAGLDSDNRHSISERAEEILANAKRRLTTMEGNLTRARSSLHASSPSASSIGSSTASPPIRLTSSTSPNSAPGHTRIPTSNPLSNDPSVEPSRRSASALGAAGGYRQPLSGSFSMNDLIRPRRRERHPLYLDDSEVDPPSEDGSGSDTRRFRDSASMGNLLSPTFGDGRDRESTRAASAMQVRGLKDQMQDLKGKISSLREQARADSMKRRSLQSLRTPSPFTHAQVDQWYAVPTRLMQPSVGTAPLGRNPWNGELESVDGEVPRREDKPHLQEARVIEEPGTAIEGTRHVIEVQEAEEARVIQEHDVESIISEYEAAQETVRQEDEEEVRDMHAGEDDGEDDMSDMRTEDGYEDADHNLDGTDYDSVSGDSLYHDAPQAPISHEDREDAFDYEHFFLHSAMGSFSQHGLTRRGSSSSFTSEDSVETTRGLAVTTEHQVGGNHERRGSGDTTSTMDTFATATEGRSSRLTTVEDDGSGPADHQNTQGIGSRSNTPSMATQFHQAESHHDVVTRPRTSSVIYSRPFNVSTTTRNRPSVSSFDSTGTQRSFPLVNKPKANGVLTPQGTPGATPQGSPDQALKNVSDSLMSETAGVCDRGGGAGDSTAIQQLARDDQILVERLVASLGKCVLGLSESGKASPEARMYRRRILAAQRLLEGMDSPAGPL
ncbi:hypothetical protein ACRALDRAFT_1075403 [Sodiomyces alcalophilus JCM 7366]|uniref:uncharacterized protein n=1 Tax=Sodiomyces alcalophilus JCM 7366 TaxID=591952 RepID=UPI0039B4C7BE